MLVFGTAIGADCALVIERAVLAFSLFLRVELELFFILELLLLPPLLSRPLPLDFLDDCNVKEKHKF